MQPEAVPERTEEDSFEEALDRRAADRAWRKQRRLVFLGGALLVALLLANAALAFAVMDLRTQVREVTDPSTSTSVDAPEETGATTDQLAALEARVQETERALLEAAEAPPDADSPTEAAAGLRRDVSRSLAHARCTDRSLRRLESSLRRLLRRDLDPETYVESDPLPRCP